ncbi:MAG: enoyl-CoA hydratase/isomerase family protein [Myxococcota bacterium]
MSVLDLEHEGALVVATVNRPEALNAIDFEVMAALEGALDMLESDGDARVFALTGAGERSFISGGDLRKFASLETAADAAAMARRMKAILQRIENLDAWTIALVNADAYGGGCETTLAFDFRIASETARFGFTQARFNVTPGWGGLTRLVELVGRPTALEWLGRAQRVPATDALEAGLVDEVVAPKRLRSRLDAWVEELATGDPALIRALKQGAARATTAPRDEAIASELEPFAQLWSGQRHHDKIARFLRRSDPDQND